MRSLQRRFLACAVALSLASLATTRAEVHVPAFTGYADPDPNGARFSQNSGVTAWRDPKITVSWFGDIKEPPKSSMVLPPYTV